MEYWKIIITLLLSAFVGVGLFKLAIRRVTIFEYEKGLQYYKGKFKTLLEPGQYWYVPFVTTIDKIDVRPCFVSITGQEILSSDGITLKLSLAAQYEIADPYIAVCKVRNYSESLHIELQLAIREIIGNAAIDELLENRNQFSTRLFEATENKIRKIGLKLISVNIKDIMFPGPLKQIFAQAVKARKEGLAVLEKARSETAALRKLANAAKMIESNPNLMNLRLVQALGESSGNTLVLGMPSLPSVLPVKNTGREIDKQKEDTPNC